MGIMYMQRLARWGLIHTIPDSKSNACKVCYFGGRNSFLYNL